MTPRYIDNTILEAWKKCKLSAWLTYGLGRDNQSRGTGYTGATPDGLLKMECGSAIHRGVESWLTQHDPLAAMQAVEAYYQPFVVVPPTDDRYSWQNVRDIFAAWLYHQQATPSRFTPHQTWVERHLTAPLTSDESIMFVSRPDAVGTLEGLSGTYGLESKTTGSYLNDQWRRQWTKSSQLTGQIYAIAHNTGDVPRGIMVQAIRISKLPTATTRCKEHGVKYTECRLAHATFDLFGPYERSPAALETWRQQAEVLAREYFAYIDAYTEASHVGYLPEDGQFGAYSNCQFCSWNDWCSQGKNPHDIELARLRKWDPLVGAPSVQ